MVIIRSENPASEGIDYWGYDVSLNFAGWREVLIPVGTPGGTREPLGWDQITGLTFTAGYIIYFKFIKIATCKNFNIF